MLIIIIAIAIVANLIISDIVANIGKGKEIGYNTTFVVSFLLTPLIGLLLVIASKELTIEEKEKIKYQETEFVEAKKYIIEKREDSEEPLPLNHPIVIISVILIVGILILVTII